MSDRLALSDGQGLSVLGDGAKWIWNQARQRWPRSESVVDVFHVSEHLHDCGRALHGEHTPNAREWADQRLDTLVTHNPVDLVRDIEQPAASVTTDAPQKALSSLRGYLASNLDGMWYRDRLRRGLPIGSGLV